VVVRKPLQCISCETKIITRTQLGHNDKQQHSFPCPKCAVTISYIVDLDQENVKGAFRDPTNARWTDSEDGAVSVLTFSDEIPVPDDMAGMFSPFLATFWNIENHELYRKDEGLRQAFIKELFPYAERCFVHFERGNWKLFDKESPSSSGKTVTVRSRLTDLYNFYTSGFAKFGLNTRAKYDRIMQRLTIAKAVSPKLYEELAHHCLKSGRIKKLWNEIAGVRRTFVNIYPYIQPLVQMRYWKKDQQDFTKFTLSDKRFDELRQLFIDEFETLCRLMMIAVGVEAIIHNKGLAVPTKKRTMNLDEFDALPNANKISFIKAYPIEDLFVPVLDTSFRNSIGHHSAHYEAHTDEVVVYASRRPGTVTRRLRYTEFADKVLSEFAAFELAAIYHHTLHISLDGKFG
jgi:hypothetical protein